MTSDETAEPDGGDQRTGQEPFQRPRPPTMSLEESNRFVDEWLRRRFNVHARLKDPAACPVILGDDEAWIRASQMASETFSLDLAILKARLTRRPRPGPDHEDRHGGGTSGATPP